MHHLDKYLLELCEVSELSMKARSITETTYEAEVEFIKPQTPYGASVILSLICDALRVNAPSSSGYNYKVAMDPPDDGQTGESSEVSALIQITRDKKAQSVKPAWLLAYTLAHEDAEPTDHYKPVHTEVEAYSELLKMMSSADVSSWAIAPIRAASEPHWLDQSLL